MPAIIPTIQTSESAQTRELHISNQGGGLALLAGAQILSQGAGDLGKVATSLALKQKQQEEKLKHLDDIRWATEALQQEQLGLAKFMADEKNQKSEDFGDRVASYTQSRMDNYSSQEQAPSSDAFRIFKQNFDHLATQSQISAIDTGANNKVNGIINSANNSISLAQDTFRTLRGVNEKQALANMVNSIAQIKTSIDAGIGQFAPDKAHKLHENLITQSVLNVMTTNPGAARAILESSKEIDEQTRYQLNNEINQASRNINIGHRNAVIAQAEGIESFARQGNIVNPLSKASFSDVLSEPQATEVYDKHVATVKTYNDGNYIVNAVSSFNRDSIGKVINTLLKPSDLTPENAVEKESLAKYTVGQLAKIVDTQKTDIMSVLVSHNQHVKGLYDVASSIEDPQDKAMAMVAANDAALLYQGPAPQNISSNEAKMYHDRPLNDRHLLFVHTAESIAKDINMATPKEVIKKIAETLSVYTKEDHAAKVYNDLVTLGKLSQQYQVAWLYKDSPWIDTYLGSLQAGKDLNVPEKTVTDIGNLVWNDPSFVNLRETITRDNLQGSKSVNGFYEGTKQFAIALTSQGKSSKEAVLAATSRIVDEGLGFTSINGKKLMVLKKDESGRLRSQNDITNIGQSLILALEQVPIHELNDTAFTATPGYSVLPQTEKLRALGRYVNERGFWQMLDNGQGAVLYGADPTGVQNFQLTDKQGKPFVVHFRDLPLSLLDAKKEWSKFAEMSTLTGEGYPVYSPSSNTTKPRPMWLTDK